MSSYDPTAGTAVAGMTGAELSAELAIIFIQPEWRGRIDPKSFALVHRAEEITVEIEGR